MSEVCHFQGFIKGVRYRAYLANSLNPFSWENFDVNRVDKYGYIQFDDSQLAYSIWVSPKRTRSYPFSRIYNTYGASKKITIIPIIKDEGRDGDRDRIQYSTFSWMNLLNTYIVLAYYESAEPSTRSNKQKITNQKFNNLFVKNQIEQIVDYHQSALHWNRDLLENKFVNIFNLALDAYDEIQKKTNIKMHSRNGINAYINKIQENFEEFKNISLKGSQNASQREALTNHNFEFLGDGNKATFAIENYLGGNYYLTPDEIIQTSERYIIQESKNTSTGSLPALEDIQDGLFKLILFSNLEQLKLDDQNIDFLTRLKLTGKKTKGSILLPTSCKEISSFLDLNSSVFSKRHQEIVKKLNKEARYNQKLQVEITANHT